MKKVKLTEPENSWGGDGVFALTCKVILKYSQDWNFSGMCSLSILIQNLLSKTYQSDQDNLSFKAKSSRVNSLSLLISAITPIDSVASPSDINVHMMLVLSPEFRDWELFPISNLITWSLGWHGLEQPAIHLHQIFSKHRFFDQDHRIQTCTQTPWQGCD